MKGKVRTANTKGKNMKDNWTEFVTPMKYSWLICGNV